MSPRLRSRMLLGLGLAVSIAAVPFAARLTGATVDYPTPYVTRAEAAMVLLLSRMREVPAVVNDGRFIDVSKGSWYERYVFMAEKYGILRADPLGRIRPNAEINRAEFLKMLTYTFGLPTDLPHVYVDVPSQSWFAPFAGAAYQYRIFPTNPAIPRLAAGNPLNHREVARAIQRLFDVRGTNFPPLEALAEARMKSAARLKISLVISHHEEEVTVSPESIKPLPPLPPSPPPELTFEDVLDARRLAEFRAELLSLVNAKRAETGLAPLRENASLTTSAKIYAEEMAKGNFFGHVSPTGKTLKERIEASGFYDAFLTSDCQCTRKYLIGENLARGQRTVAQAMDAWMASPSHRGAILHPDFQEIGFGISAGYWVEHFAGVKEEK